jgi:hypothetical protein
LGFASLIAREMPPRTDGGAPPSIVASWLRGRA